MLLTLEKITFERAGAPTIFFPDVELKTGEHALLLGPSGSGKTTLLSMTAGLLKPSRGKVLWEGQDLYGMSSALRDRVRGRDFGYVFQTLHLIPSLSLLQNIALAADMARFPANKQKIPHLLETLGLADKAHRKPDSLSQGEQQRAAVARAVLNKPKIILADEPTSALDDENAQAVMTLMMQQAKENGAALLVATHDARIIPLFPKTIRLPLGEKVAA